MNGHLSDCSHAMQRTIQQEQTGFHTVSKFIFSHKGLIDFQGNFRKFILKGDVWMRKPGRSRLSSRWWAHLLSHTHPHLSFLWGDRKGVCSKHQLFSNWQTGEETLSHPPLPLLPSPLSSRYAFTSLTPTFSSQSLFSGWLVFSSYSSTKETKEAGLLSLFSPLQREGGTRPADHPFQSCKEQAQQKVSACKIVTRAKNTCAGAESNKHSGSVFKKQRQPKENFEYACACVHAVLKLVGTLWGGAILSTFQCGAVPCCQNTPFPMYHFNDT